MLICAGSRHTLDSAGAGNEDTNTNSDRTTAVDKTRRDRAKVGRLGNVSGASEPLSHNTHSQRREQSTCVSGGVGSSHAFDRRALLERMAKAEPADVPFQSVHRVRAASSAAVMMGARGVPGSGIRLLKSTKQPTMDFRFLDASDSDEDNMEDVVAATSTQSSVRLKVDDPRHVATRQNQRTNASVGPMPIHAPSDYGVTKSASPFSGRMNPSASDVRHHSTRLPQPRMQAATQTLTSEEITLPQLVKQFHFQLRSSIMTRIDLRRELDSGRSASSAERRRIVVQRMNSLQRTEGELAVVLKYLELHKRVQNAMEDGATGAQLQSAQKQLGVLTEQPARVSEGDIIMTASVKHVDDTSEDLADGGFGFIDDDDSGSDSGSDNGSDSGSLKATPCTKPLLHYTVSNMDNVALDIWLPSTVAKRPVIAATADTDIASDTVMDTVAVEQLSKVMDGRHLPTTCLTLRGDVTVSVPLDSSHTHFAGATERSLSQLNDACLSSKFVAVELPLHDSAFSRLHAAPRDAMQHSEFSLHLQHDDGDTIAKKRLVLSDVFEVAAMEPVRDASREYPHGEDNNSESDHHIIDLDDDKSDQTEVDSENDTAGDPAAEVEHVEYEEQRRKPTLSSLQHAVKLLSAVVKLTGNTTSSSPQPPSSSPSSLPSPPPQLGVGVRRRSRTDVSEASDSEDEDDNDEGKHDTETGGDTMNDSSDVIVMQKRETSVMRTRIRLLSTEADRKTQLLKAKDTELAQLQKQLIRVRLVNAQEGMPVTKYNYSGRHRKVRRYLFLSPDSKVILWSKDKSGHNPSSLFVIQIENVKFGAAAAAGFTAQRRLSQRRIPTPTERDIMRQRSSTETDPYSLLMCIKVPHRTLDLEFRNTDDLQVWRHVLDFIAPTHHHKDRVLSPTLLRSSVLLLQSIRGQQRARMHENPSTAATTTATATTTAEHN